MAITYDPKKLVIDNNITPDFETLTPSDSDSLTMSSGRYPKAIYVGVGGDLSLVNRNGDTVVFKNVPDGSRLSGICPIGCLTATTATDLVKIG